MKPFDFNPNTTRWEAKNAVALALASKLAYRGPAAVDSMVRQWGFERSTFLASPKGARWDTQAFVASRADMVLVAFRGTEPDDLKDWITDADCVQATTEVGGVHYGFWSALESIWEPLLAAIESHQDRAQSLWFTGHSLGAALATLAVARLRRKLKPVHSLYTYGSPRVGTAEFSDRFDRDFSDYTFRYVNNADVVTRVPTREMGYSHVGQTLYFDAEGEVHADMHFWNRFLEVIKGDLEELLQGKLALFSDHAVDNYIDRALKNLSRDPF
ncbi:MAG TPA: lipase [Verrucomicrobiales bacterium]|nr:lipase [Verrucomicrobiales bacterium]